MLRLDRTPSEIGKDELVARYIFNEWQLKEKGVVATDAFKPPPNASTLSVYRTSRCGEWRIWRLGTCFVGRMRKKPSAPLVRAEVSVADVLECGLGVVSEARPHRRHADISGYTIDKKTQKSFAVKLANKAKMVNYPLASVQT